MESRCPAAVCQWKAVFALHRCGTMTSTPRYALFVLTSTLKRQHPHRYPFHCTHDHSLCLSYRCPLAALHTHRQNFLLQERWSNGRVADVRKMPTFTKGSDGREQLATMACYMGLEDVAAYANKNSVNDVRWYWVLLL